MSDVEILYLMVIVVFVYLVTRREKKIDMMEYRAGLRKLGLGTKEWTGGSK